MRLALLGVSIVLLAACDGPGLSDRQRDQVSDISSESADLVVSEHERISELEARVAQLEQPK